MEDGTKKTEDLFDRIFQMSFLNVIVPNSNESALKLNANILIKRKWNNFFLNIDKNAICINIIFELIVFRYIGRAVSIIQYIKFNVNSNNKNS